MNGCSFELRLLSLRGRRRAGQESGCDGLSLRGADAENAMRSKYAEIMQLHSHEPLTPFAHSANNRCFGCGPDNANGLRLEFLLASDSAVVSLPVVPEAFEGHPGYLHGGIIATLLDEAMSKAVRALGHPSMTRKMDVEYLRPVPGGAQLRLEGRVVRSEGRKHWAEAVIADAKETVLAHSKGLFIEIRPEAKK
jgi:uncharacterized protein (TIGR00369 family)